jgi:pimeloyl-ACP methyl ester carboxylesterase
VLTGVHLTSDNNWLDAASACLDARKGEKLKYPLAALVLLGSSAVPELARAHGDDRHDRYHIEHIETTAPTPQLNRTRFEIAVGDDALNHFDVVRVHRRGLRSATDEPVILISPFGFESEYWELSSVGYADSFAARVASAGYDVWLVDNRTAQIAPGSCESGAVDCSAMEDWGIDTGMEDALFTNQLVRFFHPLQRPVIGGYSGGSSAAIAAVNRRPQLFAGLFMWEGTLYTADPAIRARNLAFCEDDIAALESGMIVDPAVQGFKVIFNLATSAPSAPSPIPGFPPGTTNLQALIFAFAAPNPANPLNFTEGFIRNVGDPFAGTFTYAQLDRVLLLAPLIGNYAAVRFLRDTHCSIGGFEDPYTDNLDKFRGDVLVYAEGLGFGQMMVDTANLMTRARVTIDQNPAYGESDRYFHTNWVGESVRPLLRWLRDVRGF